MIIPSKFKNDIQSRNINVIPLIVIKKDGQEDIGLSVNSFYFNGQYFKPLLLSVPNISEKLNFVTKNLAISSVNLDISNALFEGRTFSEYSNDLTNSIVEIYWKSQNAESIFDCLMVFKGKVKDIITTLSKITLKVEDYSQESFHKDVPISRLNSGNNVIDGSKNKPIPMVYGHVNGSPTVTEIDVEESENNDSITVNQFKIHIDSKPLSEALKVGSKFLDSQNNEMGHPNSGLYIYKDGFKGYVLSKSSPSLGTKYQADVILNTDNQTPSIYLPPKYITSENELIPQNEIANGDLQVIVMQLLKTVSGRIDDDKHSSGWNGLVSNPNLSADGNPNTFSVVDQIEDQLQERVQFIFSLDGIPFELSDRYIDIDGYPNNVGDSRIQYKVDLFSYDNPPYEFTPTYSSIIGWNLGTLASGTINLNINQLSNEYLSIGAYGAYNDNYPDITGDLFTVPQFAECVNNPIIDGEGHTISYTLQSLLPNTQHSLPKFNIYGVGFTRVAVVSDVINKDFYVNTKGRKDLTGGEYTLPYSGRTRTSTSRNREENLLPMNAFHVATGQTQSAYNQNLFTVELRGDFTFNDASSLTLLEYFQENFPDEGQSTLPNYSFNLNYSYSQSEELRNLSGDYTPILWEQAGNNVLIGLQTDQDFRGIDSDSFYIQPFIIPTYIDPDAPVPNYFGCTDPVASNYGQDSDGNNLDGTEEDWIDDGSCIYNYSLIISYSITLNGDPYEDQLLNVGDTLVIIFSTNIITDSLYFESLIFNITENFNVTYEISTSEIEGDTMTINIGEISSLLQYGDFTLEVYAEDDNDDIEENIEFTILNPNYQEEEEEEYIPDFEEEEPNDIPVSGDLITNPADIIHHLIYEELNINKDLYPINGYEKNLARDYHKLRDFYFGLSGQYQEWEHWKFAFSVADEINSKNLIESISKNTKLIPKINNNGTIGFSTIRDFYNIEGNYLSSKIHNNDVIKYRFKKSNLKNVYTRVKVLYNKLYESDEYGKDTGWMYFYDLNLNFNDEEKQNYYNYYGFEPDGFDEDNNAIGGNELIFESDYIRDDNTAKCLRHYLLGWNMNSHNIVNLELPLKYLSLQIGDIVYFDDLINNIKINGEDYSRNYVLEGKGDPNGEGLQYYEDRNKQVIYPLFMITSTTKNLKTIKIEAIQIHDWTGSLSTLRSIGEAPENFANFSINNNVVLNVLDSALAKDVTTKNFEGECNADFTITNDTNVGSILSTSWQFEIVDIDGNVTNDELYYKTENDSDWIDASSNTIQSNNINSIKFKTDIHTGHTGKEIKVKMSTMIDVGGDRTYEDVASNNIKVYLAGDLNDDNRFDVIDVIYIVDLILDDSLNNDPERSLLMYKGDYDNNASTDVVDVIYLIEIILSGDN